MHLVSRIGSHYLVLLFLESVLFTSTFYIVNIINKTISINIYLNKFQQIGWNKIIILDTQKIKKRGNKNIQIQTTTDNKVTIIDRMKLKRT